MEKSPAVDNDELVIDITEDELIEELIDLSGDDVNAAIQPEEVPKPVAKDTVEDGEKDDPADVQNEYVLKLLCDFAQNNKHIKECRNHYLFDDAVLSKKATVYFSSIDCTEATVSADFQLSTNLESCVYFWNTRHQPDSCFYICCKKKPIHVLEAAPYRSDIIACIRGKRNVSPTRTEEEEHLQFMDCCEKKHKGVHAIKVKEEKSITDLEKKVDESAESKMAPPEDDADDLRRRISSRRKENAEVTEVMIRNIPPEWHWHDLKNVILKHIKSYISLYKSVSEDIGSILCKNKSDAEQLIKSLDDQPPHYLEVFLSLDDADMEQRLTSHLEEGERMDSPPAYDLRTKLTSRRNNRDFGSLPQEYYSDNRDAPHRDDRYSADEAEPHVDERYPRKRMPMKPAYYDRPPTHYPHDSFDYHDEYTRVPARCSQDPWREDARRRGYLSSRSEHLRRSRSPRRSIRPGRSMAEGLTITVHNEEESLPLSKVNKGEYLTKIMKQTNAFLEKCCSTRQSIEMTEKDKITPVILEPSLFKIGFDQDVQEGRRSEDRRKERYRSRGEGSSRDRGSSHQKEMENSASSSHWKSVSTHRQRSSTYHRSKSPSTRIRHGYRQSLDKIRSPIKRSGRRATPPYHSGSFESRSRSPRNYRSVERSRRLEESPNSRQGRSRSPRNYRSIERSRPLDESPTRRDSRSRSPTRRANEIMDYMQDLEMMKRRHASHWKTFEAEPHQHPLYLDELRCWQKINYYLNESSPEWMVFWKNKAATWKTNELNEMKLSLQKKYRVDRTPSPALLASIAKESLLGHINERRRGRSRSPNYRYKENTNRRYVEKEPPACVPYRHGSRGEPHYRERSLDRGRIPLDYKRTRSPSLEKHPKKSSKYRKENSQKSYRHSLRKESLGVDAKRLPHLGHRSRSRSSQKPMPPNSYNKRGKLQDLVNLISRPYSRRVCKVEDRYAEIKMKQELKEKASKKLKASESKKSHAKNKSKSIAKNIMVKDPVLKETCKNLRSTLFFLCDDQVPKQNRLLPVFQKLLGNVADGFSKLMDTALSMESKKKNFSNSLLQEEEVRSFLSQFKRNLDKISKSSSLTSYNSKIAKLVSHNLGSLLEISSKTEKVNEDSLSQKEINLLAKCTVGMDPVGTCQEVARQLVASGRTNVQEDILKSIMQQMSEARKDLKTREHKRKNLEESQSFHEDSESSESSDSSLGSACMADISKLKEQFLNSRHGSRGVDSNSNSSDNERQLEECFLSDRGESSLRARTLSDVKKGIKLEPYDYGFMLSQEKESSPVPPPPPQISNDPSFQEVLRRSSTPSSDDDDWNFEHRSDDRPRMRKRSESPALYSGLDSPPMYEDDSPSTRRLLSFKTEPPPRSQRTGMDSAYVKSSRSCFLMYGDDSSSTYRQLSPKGEPLLRRQLTEVDPADAEPSPGPSSSLQREDSYDFVSSDILANRNSSLLSALPLQSQSSSSTSQTGYVAEDDAQQDTKPVFLPREVCPPEPVPSPAASLPPRPVPAPHFMQNKMPYQLQPISSFQQINPLPKPVSPSLPFPQSRILPVPPPSKPVPQPVPPPNQKYTPLPAPPQFPVSSHQCSLDLFKPVPIKEEPRQHDEIISDGSRKKTTAESSRNNLENKLSVDTSNYSRYSEKDTPTEPSYVGGFSASRFPKNISPKPSSTHSFSDQLLLRRESPSKHSGALSIEKASCETPIPFLDFSSPKTAPSLEKKPLKGILKKPVKKEPEPENDPDFDYLYNSEEPVLPALQEKVNIPSSKPNAARDDIPGYMHRFEETVDNRDHTQRAATPSYPPKRPKALLNKTVSAILDSAKTCESKPNENTKDIVSKLMAIFNKK